MQATALTLSPDAFRALVASEFELNREQFRKHLGVPPSCIAYPWMLGSPLSLELAKRHGIRTAFGVALDYGAERRRARRAHRRIPGRGPTRTSAASLPASRRTDRSG